ncbi:MAG: hypothetical protein A2Y93_15695 [Chloroflexi bacterium RBG_13_68_17]|nr:MAG: hypothetical protein A2Y93_15695 [Chloroflexi bacterium RBG_13_68_17]
MTRFTQTLRANPLPCLLEPDRDNPGVRYLALRDLLGRPEAGPAVRRAQAAVMRSGPVPAILKAQEPEGCWLKPGGDDAPKGISTVWQFLRPAQRTPTIRALERGY